MKYYLSTITIIIWILSSAGCKKSNQDIPSDVILSKHQMMILLNDSVYAVFSNEEDFLFSKNETHFNLSDQELIIIDSLLLSAINNYNEEMKSTIAEWKLKNPNIDENYFILHPSLYNYQLVPVITEFGEKIVWINSLCKDHNSDNWKKDVLMIMDGGNCFFNLKINLTKKEYFELSVNGVA